MNCNSNLAPPCAAPMSSVDLRWWCISAVVVLVIIVATNWAERAAHAIPPFTY